MDLTSNTGKNSDNLQADESKISVIFVIFQSGNKANGGVESITQVIEKANLIQPFVITQIETPLNQRWLDAGAKLQIWSLPYTPYKNSFYRGNLTAKLQNFFSFITTNFRMYHLVKSTKFPVVHCNDIRSFWHTAFGAKLAGASVVFNIRDVKPPQESYGWKWSVATQWSDRLLVLSQEMKEQLTQRLSLKTPRKTPVEYIYSIVDPRQMYPVADTKQRMTLRKNLGISLEQFTIGYVATFNQKKAQLEFIQQAGILLKNTLQSGKVYFLGDFEPENNSYARSCQEAVKQLNLENIFYFRGYTKNIADWYRALDVVVLASQREGLARCMIESIACGTPVLSFEVCSAREILEKHNCGFVVSHGDYQGLIQKISHLAQQPELFCTMGKNGIRIAEKLFTPSQIAHEYEDFYKKIALASSVRYK